MQQSRSNTQSHAPSFKLTYMALNNPTLNRQPFQQQANTKRMVLETLFQQSAAFADASTWCRCRTACTTLKQHIMESRCPRTLIYEGKCRIYDKLDEAGAEGLEMIYTAEQWSEEKPRCCSLHCSNSTGIWTPPKNTLAHPLPDNLSNLEDIWWRNNPSARFKYGYETATPQERLTIMMEHWKYGRFGAQIKKFYVVCSESCLHDVRLAVEWMHWRNRLEFEIFLGVQELELSPTSDSQEESSDDIHLSDGGLDDSTMERPAHLFDS